MRFLKFLESLENFLTTQKLTFIFYRTNVKAGRTSDLILFYDFCLTLKSLKRSLLPVIVPSSIVGMERMISWKGKHVLQRYEKCVLNLSQHHRKTQTIPVTNSRSLENIHVEVTSL